MIENPIFVREFRSNVRCRKTLVFALVLLASMGTILLVLWPRTGVLSEGHADEMFAIFQGVYLALVVLLAPGFTATAITDERENGSFDLLFSTLLSPFQILSGKLLASLSMALLLLCVSMPVSAICALSGGISLPLLVKAYGIAALAALTYGLLGLASSALCQRSFTSVLVTYVGIVLFAGATWLPAALLSQFEELVPLWRCLRALSPFEALFALNSAERYELAVGGIRAEDTVRLHLWGTALLAAVFLATFCFFVLRPPRARRGREQRQYSDGRTAIRRKLTFPFYLIDPMRRRRPISLWRNPVFVAELRSKIFGHPKFIVRSISACVILGLLILTLIAQEFGSSLNPEQVRLAAVLFQVGLVALLAPAISSGSITDERTSGTLLMLRLTPLSAWKVVRGKLEAAFMYVVIFLLSGLPVLLALAYLESSASYWRIAAWLGVLLLSNIVFTAAGLCASTLAPTTAAATACSYGFAAALCLGTLSVLLLGSRVAPVARAAVLSLNPFVAALQITSDLSFSDVVPWFGNRLWQNNLIIYGALAVVLLLVAGIRVRLLFHRRE